MRFQYAKGKLRQAIYELTIGEGDIRKRLVDAFNLFYILNNDDFPNELREDWGWINRELNKYGALIDEKGTVIVGSVQNTMWHIKNKTGTKIAIKIVDLYLRLLDTE
jgi:hypothetical protein